MKLHVHAGTVLFGLLSLGAISHAVAEPSSVEKIRQVFPSIIAGMVCSESSPWILCGALKPEECDESVRDAIAPCMEKHFTKDRAPLNSNEESVLNRAGALCTLDGLFEGKGKQWKPDPDCTNTRAEIFAGVERYRRGEMPEGGPAPLPKGAFQSLIGDSFGRDLCERGGAKKCLNSELASCMTRLRPLVDSCVKKALEPLPEQLTREMGGEIGRSAYNCIAESVASTEGRTQFNLSELGAPGCTFRVN